MTLQSTKTHLRRLVEDRENKVVALSGLWGTGKSHLWTETREGSDDEVVKNSLYVSLFGLADMASLKLKVVQSAVPRIAGSSLATDTAKVAWREGKKALRAVHPAFAALDELELLAVPATLRNRFIVIDDIERKHEKLSIDEVMGFIDEFTQRYGSRFLLILNTDQLLDRAVWDKFREKLIDQEIVLDTSAEEAFDIAAALTPSTFAAEIKEAAVACELTNIRVLRKIIRSVNRILAQHSGLTPEILKRLVPSTSLLSAIHYKGIVDGPSFDFVLGFNSFQDDFSDEAGGERSEEEQAQDKLRSRWALLLQKLGIRGCDDYESLVVQFLRSGSFQIDAVAKIIERYAHEADFLSMSNRSSQFLDHVQWHPEITEHALVEEARGLIASVRLLDPFAVTGLHDRVIELEDGAEVAGQLVVAWISDFNARHDKDIETGNFFNRALHPDIVAAISAAKAQLHASLSLVEVVAGLAIKSGWSQIEEAVMRNAGVEDFEAAIESLSGQPLRTFMLQNMDLCANRQNYERHFGSAIDNFEAACRRIYRRAPRTRLGKLVKTVLREARLDLQLDGENTRKVEQAQKDKQSDQSEGLRALPPIDD